MSPQSSCTATHQTPFSFQAVNVDRPPHQPVTTSANLKSTRSITFANGTWLEFHSDDVKPPPVISFADDLQLLNAMWDDTPGHWGGHSVLNIKGVPIPIVYWREVYARSKLGGWKPKQWNQVKGHQENMKLLKSYLILLNPLN